MVVARGGDGAAGRLGEGGANAQTPSHKINKPEVCNVQHGGRKRNDNIHHAAGFLP